MKEALKLALEFLEDNQHYVADNERHIYVMLYNEVIKKCEAALAQQDGQSNFCAQCEAFARELKELKAQPAQEPVAWWDEERDVLYRHCTHDTDDYHKFKRTVPLYAYQPQRPWVGLTEDDREKFDEDQLGWNDLLTAADALLKEKNNG